MQKRFSQMTDDEKWVWYSDAYAYRRIKLGLYEDQVAAPFDESGKWRDERMIAAAEERLLAKMTHQAQTRMRKEEERTREMQRAGRDYVNKWAQAKGYADLDAYCVANGIELYDEHGKWIASEPYVQIIREICAGSPYPKRLGHLRLLADAVGGSVY